MWSMFSTSLETVGIQMLTGLIMGESNYQGEANTVSLYREKNDIG